MTTTVVRMDGVTKHYKDVRALDGIDLGLREHAIHGLLGRNGAGKTTIMQVLTGQLLPTSGTVEVFGERPYENSRVLSRTCFVKESQRYPDAYRVRHAIQAASLLFPAWDQRLANDLLGEFSLPPNRYVKKLSRGMLSSVGVIIGIASRAPLTFFDEPYLGLDATARQLFYDRLLADYAQHPRTVVLSTHLIDEVSELVEHVVVIDKGRVLIDADADDLRSAALTATGPAELVQAYVAGATVVRSETLGGHARLTVMGDPGRPVPAGVTVEPASLQQLVVGATRTASGATDPIDLDTLEGSTR